MLENKAVVVEKQVEIPVGSGAFMSSVSVPKGYTCVSGGWDLSTAPPGTVIKRASVDGLPDPPIVANDTFRVIVLFDPVTTEEITFTVKAVGIK